ncbi:MAG TPA: phospholipid carrier-dependent glycosyltransferase [Gemmatimonadales bacterium]|nr:phospholipid carrier-dependent glycosyltransferase [Gemmatimonadales bacterium]
MALAALAGSALVYRLGGYALLEPDEGRNAEIAREMAATGDYVLPRLNGLPYVDKPVLSFAAGALAMEALGPTETAARLPSVLFTLLTAGLVAWLAHRLYGGDGAWIAGIAFVASPFTLAYARTVIMDSGVSLWMTAAITAFYCATEARMGGPAVGPGAWSILGWVAVGLGVLTKGPVALAVPLLVMVPYALWRRRVGAVLDPLGLLAFLAVVLPWVFAVSARVPDFLRYVLTVETAGRLSTGGLGRAEAWWYFWPILAGAAFPWTALALAGLRRPARGVPLDPRAALLLCWITLPLLFFTLSQSKRPQYVLPLVPAFALAMAHLWSMDAGRVPRVRFAGAGMGVLGLGLVLAAGALGRLFPASAEVAALIPRTARWMGGVAVAGGALAVIRARCPVASLSGLALPVLALPFVGLPLLSAIGRDRSSADLARAMRPLLGARTEVVAAGVFPLSLPFYLRRPLTLATADGRELTSNYVPRRHQEFRLLPGSPLRPPSWWVEALALCDRPRLFVVPATAKTARDHLAASLPLVALSRKVAVYGPCGGDALARGP